jgi:hypothetical protein
MSGFPCHRKGFFGAKSFYFRKARNLCRVKFVFVLRKQLSRQMNGSFCRDESFVSGEIFGSAGTTYLRLQKLV